MVVAVLPPPHGVAAPAEAAGWLPALAFSFRRPRRGAMGVWATGAADEAGYQPRGRRGAAAPPSRKEWASPYNTTAVPLQVTISMEPFCPTVS